MHGFLLFEVQSEALIVSSKSFFEFARVCTTFKIFRQV
ncbi:hypothetical protein LEP1GSC125_1812 [Leptospira mayottensis 200901122]|uniref:Uncharacterized protein n=1 Tax=Leptospira mayottensis 200901122 TaxID=1193010 RepID=A0AA87SUW0_9LEPT|nr:hypothetical protein LEP1GSC125_1812 [Leptospira mayottensis 200901122]